MTYLIHFLVLLTMITVIRITRSCMIAFVTVVHICGHRVHHMAIAVVNFASHIVAHTVGAIMTGLLPVRSASLGDTTVLTSGIITLMFTIASRLSLMVNLKLKLNVMPVLQAISNVVLTENVGTFTVVMPSVCNVLGTVDVVRITKNDSPHDVKPQ